MQPENAPKHLDFSRKGFYEVWYFKLNCPAQKVALWLRLTTLASKSGSKKVAETWGIFFDYAGEKPTHIAAKQTYPADSFYYDEKSITINNCCWKDTFSEGLIESTGKSRTHRIQWKLKFQPNTVAFNHVPKLFSTLKLNKSTVITPNPNLLVSGDFEVDGQKYTCVDAHAMQGHIYGTKNAIGWAWAHCNLTDDGAPLVLEILTARIKLANLMTSPPLSALLIQYNGETFEFNTMRDSLGIRSEYRLEQWDFEAVRGSLTFKGVIRSSPDDFAGVRYEDTDGSELFCHNSKISNLELTVIEEGQVKHTFQATKTCAFEVVSRQKDPRVELLI